MRTRWDGPLPEGHQQHQQPPSPQSVHIARLLIAAGAMSVGLVGWSCTAGGRAPEVATPSLTPPAQELVADSLRIGSGVQFGLAQFSRPPWIDPHQLFLEFSDGDSTRFVPGAILALGPAEQARMPGGRMYPTRGSGTLHVAVKILSPPMSSGGARFIASVAADLPLQPASLWSVLVVIAPKTQPPPMPNFLGGVAASTTFLRPGDPPTDSLVLQLRTIQSSRTELILH